MHATSYWEPGKGHTWAPRSGILYNAGLSNLAEPGSLNHQTKHLSFTVQLQVCCFDTWDKSTLRC